MHHRTPSGHRDGHAIDFGRLIREQREAAGLSLTELEVRSGITRQQIARLERGDSRQPSPRVVTQLAEALGISALDLYTAAGCIPVGDLPDLRSWLYAKHPGCPVAMATAMVDLYEFLKDKYHLN
jgi:transcriptional regulator with XRE-family HTH domain